MEGIKFFFMVSERHLVDFNTWLKAVGGQFQVGYLQLELFSLGRKEIVSGVDLRNEVSLLFLDTFGQF